MGVWVGVIVKNWVLFLKIDCFFWKIVVENNISIFDIEDIV